VSGFAPGFRSIGTGRIVFMRDRLKSTVRWVGSTWFWPLVLLVLPDSGFHANVTQYNLKPGPFPQTTLVLCDVEKPQERHCASDVDKAMGIRLAAAAVALNTGQTAAFGLDES